MSNSENNTPRTFRKELAGIKRLWPFIRDQKLLLVIAVTLVPLIALLQMAGPLVIQNTVDAGISKGNHDLILHGSLLFLAVVVLSYISRSGQNLAAGVAVQRMVRHLRMRLCGHLLTLPAAFHDRNMSGALVTRATSDFDSLGESLNSGILGSVVDIVTLLGSFAGLLLLQWQLGILMLLILPFIAWLVAVFTRALKKALLQARQKVSSMNAFTQEALSGFSTIRVLGVQDAAFKRYTLLNHQYRDAQMKSVILDSLLYAVIDGVSSVVLGIIVWFALTRIGGVEQLTAGVMIAVVAYLQQIFHPLKELSNKIALLQGAFTAMDRIFGLLSVSEAIKGTKKIRAIKGSIAFKNVCFSYAAATAQSGDASMLPEQTDSAAQNTVLQDISFSVDSGKSLALVGATGSGKTTIIKLLLKLYDGYSGRILLDGYDLASLDGELLRRQIAVVPQDIVLFNGSIAFNIGLGAPGISRAMIEDAATQVGADAFIRELPGGYDFILREQGSNISQGQGQLLTFARALAPGPALVVLDEATSSIDPESEALIQKATDVLFRNRTVIVIAHRLSTIKGCDSILVLEEGCVVESGTHAQLMKKKGAYARYHDASRIQR
jgi:ATP-binding cassette, subfamily B, multidrug efflux pump